MTTIASVISVTSALVLLVPGLVQTPLLLALLLRYHHHNDNPDDAYAFDDDDSALCNWRD